MKMTPGMSAMQAKLGEPLTETVVRLFNERGLSGTAKELGISPSTLTFWMMHLGIQTRHVAVPPGHDIKVGKGR